MASWFPAGFPFQSSETAFCTGWSGPEAHRSEPERRSGGATRLYASVKINIHADICNYI